MVNRYWCISCALFALSLCLAQGQLAGDEANSETQDNESSQSQIEKPRLGIDKLDKKAKAKALSALVGLVILGLGLVALVWLGARVTRRYMSPEPYDHQRIKSSVPPPDEWAKKPLIEGWKEEETDP
jgi:hypothetical protein